MSIGIYMIKNIKNSKCYIGKSIDLASRWNYGHRNSLENNAHKNKHLQASWNKYGQDNFQFTIIENCEESLLNEKEIYWISYYKSYNNKYGYNKTYGGDGIVPTEETRKKMSESQKGRKLSTETKLKISLSSKGSIPWNKDKKLSSEETRKKMSESQKGRKSSTETKLKIKNNHAHYWKDKESPFKGKSHSKESLIKMSNSLKGKKAPNKIFFPSEVVENMIDRHNSGESYHSIGVNYGISKGTVKRLISECGERRQGNPKAIDVVPQSSAEEITPNKEMSWDNF